MENLSDKQIREINGGGFKEAAVTAFYYAYKYSSLTGAFVTGITIGYLRQKAKC
jgi:hypothetical protein